MAAFGWLPTAPPTLAMLKTEPRATCFQCTAGTSPVSAAPVSALAPRFVSPCVSFNKGHLKEFADGPL